MDDGTLSTDARLQLILDQIDALIPIAERTIGCVKPVVEGDFLHPSYLWRTAMRRVKVAIMPSAFSTGRRDLSIEVRSGNTGRKIEIHDISHDTPLLITTIDPEGCARKILPAVRAAILKSQSQTGDAEKLTMLGLAISTKEYSSLPDTTWFITPRTSLHGYGRLYSTNDSVSEDRGHTTVYGQITVNPQNGASTSLATPLKPHSNGSDFLEILTLCTLTRSGAMFDLDKIDPTTQLRAIAAYRASLQP